MVKNLVMRGESHEATSGYGAIESAFVEALGGAAIPSEVSGGARARAQLVLDALGADAPSVEDALATFAAEFFGAFAPDLATREPALRQLVAAIEQDCGISRVRLGRELLQVPQLLQLPKGIGVGIELTLLLSLGHLGAISLWTMWPSGDLRHVAHAGNFDPEATQTRRLVRRLLNGHTTPRGPNGDVVGMRVERADGGVAALVARGGAPDSSTYASLMRTAAGTLAVMLERDELLGREGGDDLVALEATERRLARVRFDLHDGPQQDVILLAEDLGLFRTQLESVVEGHPHGHRVLGRLEDLQARLVALDGDLRRIYVSVKSPFLQPEPLPDALAQITDDFASRTRIDPDVRLVGDFSNLTDSQQIALLSLIREALNNAREHSGATEVTIALSANPEGITATVTDNGTGFDPEVTLVRAAREGHLGLVGMHERMRLLGGQTQIDSRPGGPTVISVDLPAPPGGPSA